MILTVRPDLTARVLRHLGEASRRYPQAWRYYDRFRANRADLGEWPAWCFCPLSGAYAIVSKGKDGPMATGKLIDVSRLGALASWRLTQGVYEIDPTILDAVADTPIGGPIPSEILFRLPEWGIYVPVPGGYQAQSHGKTGPDKGLSFGFFAHLEFDTNTGRAELRIVHDMDGLGAWEGLSPEILHLIPGATIAEAHAATIAEGVKQFLKVMPGSEEYLKVKEALDEGSSERLSMVLSILLYLCSQTAEFRPGGERELSRPSTPVPKKTKDGWRLFPPDRPKVWYVGERLGKQIREALGAEKLHEAHEGHASPRPHVRRAHWHGFWSGPRTGTRRFDLRWLPPIPVAMIDDSPEAKMKIVKLNPIKNLQNETNTTAQMLEGRTLYGPASEDQ